MPDSETPVADEVGPADEAGSPGEVRPEEVGAGAVDAGGTGVVPSPPARDPRWAWPAVLAIAALAGIAYGWAADRVSVEMYYAGAVRTMAHDWHAFLFGGFDPTGTVTLDKLPGAFWIQALVVRVFGLSTATLVAPQVAAGTLAVVALFRAVRVTAGARAGVVAAAVLAGTPALAVASRGNTADGVCTLLLILAAGAALRAVRDGRIRDVVLAAVLVGLAFQVKMVEAWAIVPGLAAAYLIAAPGRRWRRFAVGALGAGVLVAVSLCWMTAVSLVPAGDRPYADGSPDNSVFYQVFAYNGVNRFGGGAPVYGLGADLPYAPSAAAVAYARERAAGANVPPADASSPGALRLVTGPVGRDAGWLLPAAVVALLGGLASRGRRPRGDTTRAGLIVWGGWLAVFVIAFDRTPHLLTYYTVLLAPPVAALCAIGLGMAYRGLRAADGRHRRATATATVAVATVAGTAAVEVALTRSTPAWLSVTTLAVTGAGVVALLAAVLRGGPRPRRSVLVAASAALLVAPVAATAGLVADGGGSFDAPYAEGGTLAHFPPATGPADRPGTYGGVVAPSTSDELWRRLGQVGKDWPAGRKVLVFTSAQAAGLVVAGVPGVVPIGGFTGFAAAPTVDQVRALITGGTTTVAIVPGPLDLRANDPRVMLITTLCKPVGVGPAARTTAGPVEYFCGP